MTHKLLLPPALLLLALSFLGCAKTVATPPGPDLSSGSPPGATSSPTASAARQPGQVVDGTDEEAATPRPAPSTEGKTPQESARKASPRECFENDDIYFDFDMCELSPASSQMLDAKSKFLRANPKLRVLIEGNTDDRGTNEYNLALGERRAYAARKYLIDAGIAAARIDTVSYGEERPVNPEQTEEAWSKNRRDHFTIND
ncbi:MAG: peptidoglycan-associated lipoprotein Pal [Pseudomonadota bacterium]